MRIPADPTKVQLRGRYNGKTSQHEPPGTTVYHAAWGDVGNGVQEWAVALDPLPESGDREYSGRTRVPHAGELPTVAKCVRPQYLSSGWFALRDLTVDAPAEGLIWQRRADGSYAECRPGCGEPHAHFQMVDGVPRELPPAVPARKPRPITGEPRIVCLVDGYQRDANAEGCMVVVDDVAAVAQAVKAQRYTGPQGTPDLAFVTFPARLPGRRYLSSVLPKGIPVEVPRYENGAARWSLASFELTHGVGTVFSTWEEAQQAISHAREAGLFK